MHRKPKSWSTLLAALLLLGPAVSAARAAPPSAPGPAWSAVVESGRRAVLQVDAAAPAAQRLALQATAPEPAQNPAPQAGMSSGKKALLIAVIAAAGTIAIYAALESKTLR